MDFLSLKVRIAVLQSFLKEEPYLKISVLPNHFSLTMPNIYPQLAYKMQFYENALISGVYKADFSSK